MTARRNLVAGLASSVWSAALGLAVVPIYLHYLGIESYGLIGFFTTVQAALQLLDMGLSATINREVARHSASDSLARLVNLFHTLSVVYWVTAGLLAIGIAALGPLLAGHWLKPEQIPFDSLRSSVVLLGVVIATRWPISLYQGALLGAHRLATTSAVNMVMTSISSLGAVLILAYVSATIEAFFVWQGLNGIIYALIMRKLAWGVFGNAQRGPFDWRELQRVWAFSAGMSGVAVTGMLLGQADKLILSKVLNLAAFGQYMLATVVASGLYLILAPTFNLIFPKLSALMLRPQAELVSYYRRGTRLLTAALFPAAIVFIVFSRDVLFLWTRDAALAEATAPVVRLFLIGTTLNGVMHFPYALQLASGHTRAPITNNLILLLIMLPMTAFLAIRFGAIGGASAWALLNFLYVFLGTWLTHRSLLPDLGRRWLVVDVGIPLAASASIVGGACFWLSRLDAPRPLLLAFGLIVAGLFSLSLIQAERRYQKFAPGLPLG